MCGFLQLQEDIGNDITFTGFPQWSVYKHSTHAQGKACVLRGKQNKNITTFAEVHSERAMMTIIYMYVCLYNNNIMYSTCTYDERNYAQQRCMALWNHSKCTGR